MNYYRALLIAVLTMLALCAPAQASEIVAPEGTRFQEWTNESKMPTPDGVFTVIQDLSGCTNPEARACTRMWDRMIFDPDPYRDTFMHELGHNFDWYRLQDWQRERLKTIFKDHREWYALPYGPAEKFADTYARCSETGVRFKGDPNLYVKGEGQETYGFRLSEYLQVCRLILAA